MRWVEASGRSVDEAVERALTGLGVVREDVEIEVVDAGARGMLGLGAREARVRVALKEGPAAAAHQLSVRLLRTMGFAAAVHVHERDGVIAIEIRGHDLGPLIGRRGSTLEEVEFLVGLMVTRQTRTRARIVVDVEGYRERRRLSLEELARRTAEHVRRAGREVMLEPMEAKERRVIHTALADHPHVRTYSRGEGVARRVVIAPKSAGRTVGV